jgi:hypothetical protein
MCCENWRKINLKLSVGSFAKNKKDNFKMKENV